MNGLPTARQKLVAAAVSRGIPISRVALNLGVHFNSVTYALRTYEGKTGRQVARCRAKPNFVTKAPVFKLCEQCGEPFRSGGPDKRSRYCSFECQMLHQRVLSDSEIVAAIESRKAGETWSGICRRTGVTHDTLRTNIWQFLRKQDLLTWETVEAIWRPAPSLQNRTFSVAHLEAKYGQVHRECRLEVSSDLRTRPQI